MGMRMAENICCVPGDCCAARSVVPGEIVSNEKRGDLEFYYYYYFFP